MFGDFNNHACCPSLHTPFLDLTGVRLSEGHALDLGLSSGISSERPNLVHSSAFDHKAVGLRLKFAYTDSHMLSSDSVIKD